MTWGPVQRWGGRRDGDNHGPCIWGCGATVEWAATWKLDEVKKAGERPGKMPLDLGDRPDHDTYANIAVSGHATGRVLARVLRAGEEPLANERRRVTHFATCPTYRGKLPDNVTKIPAGVLARRGAAPGVSDVPATVTALADFRRAKVRPR